MRTELDQRVPGATKRLQTREDLAAPLEHPQTEHFRAERIAQPVHHQSGKTVRLGVQHAIGIRHVVESQHFAPQSQRPGQGLVPEPTVREFGRTTHQPHDDFRTRIVQPVTNQLGPFALGLAVHRHQVPRPRLIVDAPHTLAVHQGISRRGPQEHGGNRLCRVRNQWARRQSRPRDADSRDADSRSSRPDGDRRE